MRGNYIDLARYLDSIQKQCRTRLITFDQIRMLIARVEKGHSPYAAIDGGKVSPDYCYHGMSTLALVTKDFKGRIVIGIQRTQAQRGIPVDTPFLNPCLNRGKWHLVSRKVWGENEVKDWANYEHDKFILESTGMEI